MEKFSEINNALDVNSSIIETTVEKFENTKI